MTDAGMSTELGRVGIWTCAFDGRPATRVREAAAELEELGYGAIWYGEAFGRDTFGQAWLLLSATRRLAVASGIARIDRHDPVATASATRALGEAFPGRYVLGLGGHRVDTVVQLADEEQGNGASGGKGLRRGGPVAAMRAYLDVMDAAPVGSPSADPAPRRLLAALGPRMLELAATRTGGAHPYFVPVEHTARARETMGRHAFLGVEQAVVLDTDLARAREVATAHVGLYVDAAPHQQVSLRRLGFGDADLAGGPNGGPSRRLVDAIVAYGDVEVIRRRVREHLDAGADHVCLQVLTADPAALPDREWRELAPALLS